MNGEIQEKVKEIKRSFRRFMNGPGAQSMRENGLDYKINWGVPFTELTQMAEKYGKNAELADALWNANVRECKILATLIMPHEEMTIEQAEHWMSQTENQEIAEMISFNLFRHLSFAPYLGYKWITDGKELYQLCGYHILSALFKRQAAPDKHEFDLFVGRATKALASGNAGLRHATYNSLLAFAGLGDDYQAVASAVVAQVCE